MRTWKEGIHGGQKERLDHGAFHRRRASQATSLADLAEDYVFFTHGAFFCHSSLDVDPVWDYIQRVDPTFGTVQFDCPGPIFQGLELEGNPSWNHILMAAPRAQFRAFDYFMRLVSGADWGTRTFYQCLSQRLPVPDVLALARASVLPVPCPLVMVVTYSPNGNNRLVAFEPARCPPADLPHVVFHPPEETVILLANAYFSEQERPFEAIEGMKT